MNVSLYLTKSLSFIVSDMCCHVMTKKGAMQKQLKLEWRKILVKNQ